MVPGVPCRERGNWGRDFLREQRNMGLNASDALHCTLRWKDSGLTYKDVDRSFSEGGGRELHVFCMKA